MKDTLHLFLHKQWFDMILQGVKKEEYRAISDYWIARLLPPYYQRFKGRADELAGYHKGKVHDKGFTKIHFVNGYGSDKPCFDIEFKGIEIKCPKLDWCPKNTDLSKHVFAIDLGKILKVSNLN